MLGGTADLGNGRGGIYVGAGTSSTTIGGALPAFQDKILYSRGPGVTIASSRGDVVLGNADPVQCRRRTTVTAAAAQQADRIGGRGAGQPGVLVTGVVTGTKVEGNAISGNTGDGVMLVKARRLMIGGSSSVAGNGIVQNQSYGLSAYGACSGTVVQQNVIAANAMGNVNLTKSRGITYIPK